MRKVNLSQQKAAYRPNSKPSRTLPLRVRRKGEGVSLGILQLSLLILISFLARYGRDSKQVVEEIIAKWGKKHE
jgi:hypothetical protein